VRVAGSSPVIRSALGGPCRPVTGRRPPGVPSGGRSARSGTAVWPSGSGKGLQNPVPRFNSGHRLHPVAADHPRPYDRRARARSSAGERFPDTEEVTGSNPVAPTTILAGQSTTVRAPVAPPACLGRGRAARPPRSRALTALSEPSEPGPGHYNDHAGWSPPRSSPRHGGLMPAILPETCAAIRHVGVRRAHPLPHRDPVSQPTGDPLRPPAVPGRQAVERGRSRCLPASQDGGQVYGRGIR
jgi:hypothetical protein